MWIAQASSADLESPLFHVARIVHGPSQVGPRSRPSLCWEYLLLCIDLIRSLSYVPLFPSRIRPYALYSECSLLPSSYPFTVDPRRVSLALVDYALAIARVETIQYNFLHCFNVAARVCRRQDRPRHLFPPPRLAYPYSSLLSRTRIFKPSRLASSKLGNRAPLYLSLSVCLLSFSPDARRSTELPRRRSPRWSRALSPASTLHAHVTISFRAASVLFPSYFRIHTSVE